MSGRTKGQNLKFNTPFHKVHLCQVKQKLIQRYESYDVNTILHRQADSKTDIVISQSKFPGVVVGVVVKGYNNMYL